MRWGDSTPWAIKREQHRVMGDDEWRLWFAWYPVCLEDGTWAWRETVQWHQPMRYNVARYRAAAD